jgi:hypothetical protein
MEKKGVQYMDDKDKQPMLINLITDDDFVKLQSLSTDSNFYRITGMANQEIKHSNTIAWFFYFFCGHNLGSLFIQKFLTLLYEEKQDYFRDQNINVLKLLLSDLENIEVIRERENDIDLLIKTTNDNLVICIENKVRANITDGQLDKYYEYVMKKYEPYNNKIFILLTPEGYDVPEGKSSNPDKWVSASYEHIVKILRSFSEMNIGQKVQYIIKDYIELLEKEHIVENSELNAILEKLCAKHSEAIDLLVEYKNQFVQSQSVIKRIKEIFVKTFDLCNKILHMKTRF